MSNNTIRSLTALSLTALLAGIGTPAQAAALPGGAGSLTETYQDWGIACQTQKGTNACIMRQTQTNTKTHQHVLTVEFQRNKKGKLLGALLMPFGLALKQGVVMQVDDTAAEPALAFTTCLPAGCLAPFAVDKTLLKKFTAGTDIKLTIHAISSGKPVTLKASLKGFSAALNRIDKLQG